MNNITISVQLLQVAGKSAIAQTATGSRITILSYKDITAALGSHALVVGRIKMHKNKNESEGFSPIIDAQSVIELDAEPINPINEVCVIGRAGGEAEVYNLESGKSITTVSLFTTLGKDESTVFKIKGWTDPEQSYQPGKVLSFARKGEFVGITGLLRSYHSAATGVTYWEVTAYRVDLLGGKPSNAITPKAPKAPAIAAKKMAASTTTIATTTVDKKRGSGRKKKAGAQAVV